MRINQNKIRTTIKKAVFIISLSICIISAIFSSQWKNEKHTIDLKTAATISIGLGVAIELFTLDRKHF